MVRGLYASFRSGVVIQISRCLGGECGAVVAQRLPCLVKGGDVQRLFAGWEALGYRWGCAIRQGAGGAAVCALASIYVVVRGCDFAAWKAIG